VIDYRRGQELTDAAVRADALGDGKTVKQVGVKPGTLLDPGQVILTLA
jgi:hypothetical protein